MSVEKVKDVKPRRRQDGRVSRKAATWQCGAAGVVYRPSQPRYLHQDGSHVRALRQAVRPVEGVWADRGHKVDAQPQGNLYIVGPYSTSRHITSTF